jgi:uncharacterized protein YdcH (DUF465 family)
METESIPSLVELASNCIQMSVNTLTLDNKLLLLGSIWGMTSSPSIEKLKSNLLYNFMDAFPLLLNKYSKDHLVDIVGESAYDKLEKDYNKLQKDIKYIKSMRGNVIDREIIKFDKDECGFYPYSALKCGVEWPKDVVVTKRETYLSDTEFQNVFKMSKEEFNLKDKIMKTRLKKEVGLF